jgi:cytoskeletal protein RodZ
MINIVNSKKKLDRELEELELEYSKGNIDKKEYFARKRDIGQELETFTAVERVRRMQQRGAGPEKTLDDWSDQEEEKKKLADEAEKQEMLKKFITKPESVKARNLPGKERFGNKAKIGLLAFIILAFVVGTSMGSMFISKPSENPQISMAVNASAFLPPEVANNTTTTTTKLNTTTKTTTNTQVATTTPTSTQNTQTNNQPQTNTPTNTATNTETEPKT